MRILVYSPAFLPSLGGLEIATAELADQSSRAGHDVVVVTTTASNGDDPTGYRVIRRPSPLQLLLLVRWCEVVVQQNVSLRGLWPLLLVRRPLVISHHSWYRRPDGRVAWQDRLKRLVSRRAAASIPVSQALARDLGGGTVIPNAYRDSLFRRLPDVERDRDLLFVGRLVSDKGADLLLEAVASLARTAGEPSLTIVGEGPERGALEAQVARLGLQRVSFTGTRSGEELVRTMSQHRVLVVPSRYEEPFGIVALEGIACGCLVVGSAGGGLTEAIGPCGSTFPNGDVAELARALTHALARPSPEGTDASVATTHLESHRLASVTRRYLAVIEGVIAARTGAAAPRGVA